jgi:hypothetical protein
VRGMVICVSTNEELESFVCASNTVFNK